MTDSQQLLTAYVRDHSETAFGELVRCYLDLVYSTAVRLVDGDRHRAEDVAQIVFTDLARMAHQFAPEVALGGWLHRHTYFVAAKFMRGERRRLVRERKAAEMNLLQDAPHAGDSAMASLLDETINELEEADRAAIQLRFFEQKDYRAVGARLNTSEDAARMRVNRALEKLHDRLNQRGVRTSAAALSAVLTANAVHSAPAGLAATISAASLASTAAATTTVITTKTIAMTTLSKVLGAATIVILAGTGIYEARQTAHLRDQIQTLQQQQAPLAEQVRQWQNQFAATTNQLAGLLVENQRLKSRARESELLKLRGDVAQLKNVAAQDARSPVKAEAASWSERVAQLKQYAERWPGKKTPEIQLLTVQDWLNVTANRQFGSDADYRDALSELRTTALKNLGGMVKDAVAQYAEANAGQMPSTPSQLAAFLNLTPDLAATILSGYETAKPGEVSVPQPGPDAAEVTKWAMLQKGGPADPEFDPTFVFYNGGYYYYGPIKTTK